MEEGQTFLQICREDDDVAEHLVDAGNFADDRAGLLAASEAAYAISIQWGITTSVNRYQVIDGLLMWQECLWSDGPRSGRIEHVFYSHGGPGYNAWCQEPGWYFTDEAETPVGPYATRPQAKEALQQYVKDL